MTTFLLTAASTLLALFQAIAPAAPTPAAPSASSVPTPGDATKRMDLACRTNGLLRLDFPWHLKATYQVLGDDGKPTDAGTYEEWRNSKDIYRIALHSPSISVEEFSTGHGVFITGLPAWPGKPLSAIQTLIEHPIDPPAHPEKTTLNTFEKAFGPSKLACIAQQLKGSFTKQGDPDSYCFASENAVLLYSNTQAGIFQTLFKDVVVIQDQYLAKDIEMYLLGKPWLKVQVDSIARINPEGLQALTVPANALQVIPRARQWIGVTGGDSMKKVSPTYPSIAKMRGIQGIVVLNGIVNTSGRFGKLNVLAGPQVLQQAAIDAVEQWTYSPFLLDGHPAEMETDVQVMFDLGR